METNTRTEQREARRDEWRAHIERQRQSGMSIKSYCETQGLKKWQFSYFRKVIEPSVNGFVELKSEALPLLPLEVGGCRILLARSFDAELLRQVVAVLKAV